MHASTPVRALRAAERRKPSDADAERRRMRKQIADWPERSRDPAVRARTLDLLTKRRGDSPLQIEAVEKDGLDVLVVSGELLITAEELEKLGGRRSVLDEFGLTVDEGPAGIRVLREAVGGRTVRGRTVDVADQLRRKEIPVRPHYVFPLGMVRKAEGGPEPTTWTQPWPAAAVSGPKVAVIDTGITDQTRTDGWLAGLAVAGANIDVLDARPVPDGLLDLGAGHGTFAAGIVQQVAPGADLRVYQALDTDGLAAETAVAAAVVAAVDDGMEIINLSLGTDVLEADGPLSLRAAVRYAQGKALLVCAAGNTGDGRDVYPAAFAAEFDHVVSVAALARDDGTMTTTPSAQLGPDRVVGAPWSTRGGATCCTFGEGVVSTFVQGTESPEADPDGPDTFGADPWASWSGTSFAAPQIVGAIVRVLQDPAHSGLSPREALDQQVLATAPDLGGGWGRALVILPV